MPSKIPISSKTKRTPEQLRLSSVRLHNGMRYLSERLELALRFANKTTNSEISGLLASVHDAFLIHSRRMIDFLYCVSNNVYDDDFIAEDYFATPDVWQRQRPSQPGVISRAKEDIGKLIAHFTYESDADAWSRKEWETSNIYVGVFDGLQSFLRAVDPSLIDAELSLLRSDNPEIVICHPVYPPEAKPPYQIRCTRDLASGVEITSTE
jgi:hypothetical protein